MKKIICVLVLLGLAIGAYEECYTEVKGQMSYSNVSNINYQTYEQAKAACYLQKDCYSIHFMQINEYTKAYQLRGNVSAGYTKECLNVYKKSDSCYAQQNSYNSPSNSSYNNKNNSYDSTNTYKEKNKNNNYDSTNSYKENNNYAAKVDNSYSSTTNTYVNNSKDSYSSTISTYDNSNSYASNDSKNNYNSNIQNNYDTTITSNYGKTDNYNTKDSNSYNSNSNYNQVTASSQPSAYSSPTTNYQENIYATTENSSTCTYDKNVQVSYVQNIYGGKLYRGYEEAQLACNQYNDCLGITKVKASSLGCYNNFDTKPDYMYQLGKGYYVPDTTGNYVESYRKKNCKKVPRCNYKSNIGYTSSGCVQNCKDYSTLEEAQSACYNDPLCLAITYTKKNNGGSASLGYGANQYGYQLRGSKTLSQSNSYEITYDKGSCEDDSYSNYYNPTDNCQPQISYDSYLPGCIDNCRDYSSIDEALIACGRNKNCGGITYSSKELGGLSSSNAYNGIGGYQLRASNIYVQSRNGEISYLMPKNCNKYKQIQTQCAYKQDYRMQYNVEDYKNSQVYSTYQDAQNSCSSNSNCYGIYANENTKEYRISTGRAYQSQVAYLKGTCTNDDTQVYPILYSECNYGGQQYVLKDEYQTVDISQYQSMYIPDQYYLSCSYSDDYSDGKTTEYEIRSSILCKGALTNLLKNYKAGYKMRIRVKRI